MNGTGKDGCNIRGLLRDLAKDGSGARASTPTEKAAGSMLPVPSRKDVGMIPPASAKREASWISPSLTRTEAIMFPDITTDPTQQGTPQPYWPATLSSKSGSSIDDTEVEESMREFQDWLCIILDSKRMLDDEMNVLVHHLSITVHTAIPIFQQAGNKNPELCVAAQAYITVAVYAMHEMIFSFNTQPANIMFSGRGKWKNMADMEDGRNNQVPKE